MSLAFSESGQVTRSTKNGSTKKGVGVQPATHAPEKPGLA